MTLVAEKRKRRRKIPDEKFRERIQKITHSEFNQFWINNGDRLTPDQIRYAAKPENYPAHRHHRTRGGAFLEYDIVETLCQFHPDRIPQDLLQTFCQKHPETILLYATETLDENNWDILREKHPRYLLEHRPEKLRPEQLAQFTFKKRHFIKDALTLRTAEKGKEGTQLQHSMLIAVGNIIQSKDPAFKINPEIQKIWKKQIAENI
jgi:hypothetical protein